LMGQIMRDLQGGNAQVINKILDGRLSGG
jgi:hypothetical protein